MGAMHASPKPGDISESDAVAIVKAQIELAPPTVTGDLCLVVEGRGYLREGYQVHSESRCGSGLPQASQDWRVGAADRRIYLRGNDGKYKLVRAEAIKPSSASQIDSDAQPPSSAGPTQESSAGIWLWGIFIFVLAIIYRQRKRARARQQDRRAAADRAASELAEQRRLRQEYTSAQQKGSVPLDLRLRIEYVDQSGARTSRDIHALSYQPRAGLLHAYCQLRQEARSFSIQSIEQAIDLSTGEIISNVRQYLGSHRADVE